MSGQRDARGSRTHARTHTPAGITTSPSVQQIGLHCLPVQRRIELTLSLHLHLAVDGDHLSTSYVCLEVQVTASLRCFRQGIIGKCLTQKCANCYMQYTLRYDVGSPSVSIHSIYNFASVVNTVRKFSSLYWCWVI